MIFLVTGKPGHGKSYYAVRKALRALDEGKWVATNVELAEGWSVDYARLNPLRTRRRRERMAQRYRQRLHVTPDLEELTRLRVPFCGQCRNCQRGRTCLKEGRGVMVLDEAHMWLNARTWDQDETGQGLTRAEATAQRLKIVRFFSQHRKLGWDLYLITQDETNLDSQVRRNFEYHIHLKNLRAFKVPLIGLPLFPASVFVAVTTWHDNEKSRLGVEAFRLQKRLAGLYDSMATSHGLELDAPDAIWMDRRAPAGLTDAAPPARAAKPAAGAAAAGRRPPVGPPLPPPGAIASGPPEPARMARAEG